MEGKTYISDIIRRSGVDYMQYHITDSRKDKDFFDILTVKEIFKNYPECNDTMHCHNFNLILWTRGSHGTHIVDFQKYTIYEDCIFFLSSNNLHLYKPTILKDDIVIIFSTDFIQHIDPSMVSLIKHLLLNRINDVAHCTVPIDASSKLNVLLNLMEIELDKTAHDAIHETCLASLLSLFLIITKRECRWGKEHELISNSQSFNIYTRFIELVEQNYKVTHSPFDYAQELGVSVCLLYRYVKRHEQCTPLQIISNRVILEAKRMLRFTPLRIKEISTGLGFEDPSYFNKFFRRNVGLTPMEFRRMD